ncbi:MAG TPA: fatty acid desaturase [Polyangiaceae bacterium]
MSEVGHTEPSPFVVVEHGDPHATRRRELLRRHPEVRALMGYDRRTALVIVAVVALELGLAWWIGRTKLWGGAFTFVALAYFLGAVMNHWLAMGIHECSHNLAARSSCSNRWLAILANVPGVVPSAMPFFRHHQRHHTYLGIEGTDNDLPSRGEIRIFGSARLAKLAWLFALPLVAPWARGFMRKPDRWERINIAVMVAVDIAIVALFGYKALFYLLLSTFFGTGLHPVAAHWVHEHYLFERRQETYSYYGVLNWVTFNVGYHVEHHDLYNIPGWRLPALRALAPEMYEGLRSHRSWTLILARFVLDPALTHRSRIARTLATFDRAKLSRAASAGTQRTSASAPS